MYIKMSENIVMRVPEPCNECAYLNLTINYDMCKDIFNYNDIMSINVDCIHKDVCKFINQGDK